MLRGRILTMVLSHLHGIILQRYHVNFPLLGILISEFLKAQHHLPKQKRDVGAFRFMDIPKLKVTQIRVAGCTQVILAVWGGQTAPLNLPCNKKSPLKMEAFGRFFSKKSIWGSILFASPSWRQGFSEVWRSHANSQHDGSIGMQFLLSVNGFFSFLIRKLIRR